MFESIIEQFRAKIQAYGLNPPEFIEPDKFYRFPGRDKSKSNRAGWCRLFSDYAGGTFGDFSSDLSETWFAEKPPKFKIKPVRAIQDERNNLEAQHAVAAQYATATYKKAGKANSNHPYLEKKKIPPVDIKQINDTLLIPIRDEFNNILSLQFIKPSGEKRFLKGARKKGCFAFIGKVTKVLYMCEGYATGVTIHSATRSGVIVAMDCGNLLPVAKAVKGKYLHSNIIVCSDLDSTGIDKALKAAKEIHEGSDTIIPSFKNNEKKLTDFNDLQIAEGLETVKQQIYERSKEILKNLNNS